MQAQQQAETMETRLAARLLTERQARGWPLAELAARSGVSRAMLSKIERREASPTAGLLHKLAAALGMSLGELFGRLEDAGGQISRAAEQTSRQDEHSGMVQRLISPTGGGPVQLSWGELAPGATIEEPAAAYAGIADRQIVLLDGCLTLTQGPSTYRVEPGDCLRYGPPDAVRLHNPADAPCSYLVATLHRR